MDDQYVGAARVAAGHRHPHVPGKKRRRLIHRVGGFAVLDGLKLIRVRPDQRRFRANFYVDWGAGGGFYENELVNRRLRIGDRLEIMLLALDPRCKMITIDPETGETMPRLLKHVARKHDGYAGVYAAVLIEGTVRPGDEVRLLDD